MVAQDFISLVLKEADSLRTAGILMLAVNGCEVHLAPAKPSFHIPSPTGTSDAPDYPDPLDDPATFGGQDPDAVAPGFDRENVDLD